MGVGLIIFLLAFVVLMQPIMTILDTTTPMLDASGNVTHYGTDANGSIVPVPGNNAAIQLTKFLLYGVGFFMIIGFVIWLIMRAPQEPDFPQNPYAYQGGRP